ncbi:hypothetical protein HID58_042910 [Brassica napus]|uniref:Uncharacterized protein n=1 Tax=Brassica napus TaxID=3708 RepID=A0ABQ8BEZ2_BRANA|nr:hypothetical protein HID58_042910 [Brassica napus]
MFSLVYLQYSYTFSIHLKYSNTVSIRRP